jgi:hypothetical protein
MTLATTRAAPNTAIIGTITGPPNTGKTSLASTFRKPYLLRTEGEDVPSDIPEKRRPISPDIIDNEEVFWDQMNSLRKDDHDFSTLIIDSIGGLDEIFARSVMGDATSLAKAAGGYGAGYEAVAAKHGLVRKAADILRRERGMSVIFIGHSDIVRIEPPDADPYTSYSLRLHKKSLRHYIDSVDLVGFIKQETIVRDAVKPKDGQRAQPGKAISTGDRVLVTYLTPANVSKNRMGINEDLPFAFGENPIYRWLKAHKKPVTDDGSDAHEPINEGDEA